jgi:aminopeptidase C
MELFNPKNTDLLTKLIESLNKSSQIKLPTNLVQESSLGMDQVERVFGTHEQFMNRYRGFEDIAFSMMKDKKNLAFGADVGDVDLMRKMGRMDLSVFHYDARNKLRTLFNDNVLQIDKLLSEARSSWNGI